MPSSSHDASRLRLDSPDDTLNLILHETQRRNDLFASNSLDIFEGYASGRLNLAIQVGITTDPHIFDLVCRRQPSAIESQTTISNNAIRYRDFRYSLNRTNWDDKAMRAGVSHLIEGPKGMIPSLVWLESDKQLTNFWSVVAKSGTVEFSLNSLGGIGEGKTSVLRRASSPQTHGRAVDGMVECIAEVPCGVLDVVGDLWRKRTPLDFDCKDFLSGLRIHVDHWGVFARG